MTVALNSSLLAPAVNQSEHVQCHRFDSIRQPQYSLPRLDHICGNHNNNRNMLVMLRPHVHLGVLSTHAGKVIGGALVRLPDKEHQMGARRVER